MRGITPSQDTTIPIGSVVRVVNTGRTYSNYVDMGMYMQLKKYPRSNEESAYTTEGATYSVVAKARHPAGGHELLGLKDSAGQNFIIGLTGVEVVSIATPPEDLRAELSIVRAQLWAAEQKLKMIAELLK